MQRGPFDCGEMTRTDLGWCATFVQCERGLRQRTKEGGKNRAMLCSWSSAVKNAQACTLTATRSRLNTESCSPAVKQQRSLVPGQQCKKKKAGEDGLKRNHVFEAERRGGRRTTLSMTNNWWPDGHPWWAAHQVLDYSYSWNLNPHFINLTEPFY